MAAHAADGGYRSKSFHRPVSGQRASPQDMASGFPRMGVGMGVGLRGVEGGEREGWGVAEAILFMTQKSQSIMSTIRLLEESHYDQPTVES